MMMMIMIMIMMMIMTMIIRHWIISIKCSITIMIMRQLSPIIVYSILIINIAGDNDLDITVSLN